MNPTQNPTSTTQEPVRDTDGPASWLAGLLTDSTRFRTWIATATKTAAQPATLTGPDTTDPIGYTLTDEGHAVLAEAPATGAPGTAAPILQSAALYLERHGWIQGCYYDATSGSFTPPACLVGAIGMACYGGPVDAPAQHFDDPGFLDFEEAVLHLDRYLLVSDGSESYDFNDAKGRQVTDVCRVLRQAADTPTEELIDAIRAIDQKNTDIAALAQLVTPSGIWGEHTTATDTAGGDADESNLVDCLFCGAPGGYPYCQGSFNGQMSCADVVAADDAEQAAQDGDVR